jgi:small-conductance mechanosensitive channel
VWASVNRTNVDYALTIEVVLATRVESTGSVIVSAPSSTALNGFWHDHSHELIVEPIQVVVVIIVALLVRAVLHRMITRLTRSSAEGRVPRILSPLRERAANSAFLESAGFLSERRRQRAETIGSVLNSAVSFLIFVLAFMVILDVIGVNLLPFVAGTSLVGLALGFGAQNIIKDFLAGMFMILEDQYGVGDVIDLKEASGTVEAVGLRTTRLRDGEGTVWYMRNGEIIRVGNKSQQFAQVVLDVPIHAVDDWARAATELAAAGAELYADERWQPSFLGEPEVLGIESMDQTLTTLRLTAKVRPLEQWRVARELRGRIRSRFDAVDIAHRLPEAD